jgi:protein-S-isoprenylcysteine O-methyltransferase Ste14
MAMIKFHLGKILYGLLFCAAFPAFLIWWSTKLNVNLPLPQSWHAIGFFALVSGSVLMIKSMHQLWREGKGLPMNAYPPKYYVRTGPYSLFRHPIYAGFCMASAGLSVFTDSPEGLYAVTPVVILLCITLVAGFEQPDLTRRFLIKDHSAIFSLPAASGETLTWSQKLPILCAAFIPWFILYEILIGIGWNVSYVNSMTAFEKTWPVFEWAEVPYAFTYLFVFITPALLRTKSDARAFLTFVWLATVVGIFLQVVLPFYCEPRHFTASSIFANWILLERAVDGPAAALPSFHVLWAMIAAIFWSRRFSALKFLWWAIASTIALSCIATGVHSIADVVSSLIIFIVLYFRNEILLFMQTHSEQIANSWRAWQIGPLRIINHCLYAGVAAAFGTFILTLFTVDYKIILIVTSCALMGGVLWGQYIEGSTSLLRPFGYFGALFGGIGGVTISYILFGGNFFVLLSTFALAAPWTQAIGRLRCLVQGCCHGRSYDGILAIKYINEHSRVAKISGLKNISVHNTQLYSLGLNFIIGCFLFRLWHGEASPTVIIGGYFILTGCGRFIEEGYRGEVQTKYFLGLSVYQWMSILFVITGILLSTLKVESKIIFMPAISFSSVATILTCGLVWTFAMGMDFPKSSIRFSRLTG